MHSPDKWRCSSGKLFIDGNWEKPSKGGRLDAVNPATEGVFHGIAERVAEDVDNAVVAARSSFDQGGWPNLTGLQRAKYLRAITAGGAGNWRREDRLGRCGRG